MNKTPEFAVVGHPNKGKSSIVATLAQNDAIHIDLEPGTTKSAQRYPMSVDGKVLYTLIDTPGFQRARAVLGWLQEHSMDAADRSETLRAFIIEHRNQLRFADECQLLQPIVDGAGIIYVVDGSVPYSQEYEAEMEILRWSGRPSMALINPIRDENYVEQWRSALSQYFRIVRVFDAQDAGFSEQLSLLRSFGQLEQDWEQALADAIMHLQQQYQLRQQDAAGIIASQLTAALPFYLEEKLPNDSDEDYHKKTGQRLEIKWQQAQRGKEMAARKSIEQLYQHSRIERQELALVLEQEDLFATEHWYLWGLNKRQMISVAGGAGASVGLIADLAVGGASAFIGAIGGGILGGLSAWYYSSDIARWKVIANIALGGELIRFGPSRHHNFPFVLLSRALWHWQSVVERNHAWRTPLTLEEAPRQWLDNLPQSELSELEKEFKLARDGEGRVNELQQRVFQLMNTLQPDDNMETKVG